MVEEHKRSAAEMPDFTVEPVDVLNTSIEKIIGSQFY